MRSAGVWPCSGGGRDTGGEGGAGGAWMMLHCECECDAGAGCWQAWRGLGDAQDGPAQHCGVRVMTDRGFAGVCRRIKYADGMLLHHCRRRRSLHGVLCMTGQRQGGQLLACACACGRSNVLHCCCVCKIWLPCAMVTVSWTGACLVCLPGSLGHVHRTLGELAEHLRVYGMLPGLLNCVQYASVDVTSTTYLSGILGSLVPMSACLHCRLLRSSRHWAAQRPCQPRIQYDQLLLLTILAQLLHTVQVVIEGVGVEVCKSLLGVCRIQTTASVLDARWNEQCSFRLCHGGSVAQPYLLLGNVGSYTDFAVHGDPSPVSIRTVSVMDLSIWRG
jgi:hypothetical protein